MLSPGQLGQEKKGHSPSQLETTTFQLRLLSVADFQKKEWATNIEREAVYEIN